MSISDELIRQAMAQIPVSGQSQEAEESQSPSVNDYVKQMLLTPPDTVGSRISGGFRGSATGIAAGLISGNGITLNELKARGVRDPNFIMDSIENVAAAIGDIPAMIAGGIVGSAGGPIGEVAGAFATPEVIKSIYREYLNATEGTDKPFTFGDFIKSTANVFKSGAIAGAEGAAFGAVARVMQPLMGMKQFKGFFESGAVRYSSAVEKGAEKLGIDLIKTPLHTLEESVVNNILKKSSPIRGGIASAVDAAVGKIPTEIGKSAARGSLSVAAETAALTTVSSMLGQGDFSIESFTRNLAVLLPFKIGHAFANKIKVLATEHGLDKILKEIDKADSETEANKILQITYQEGTSKETRQQKLERKGLQETEKGKIEVKEPTPSKETIPQRTTRGFEELEYKKVDKELIAEEKRKQIELKKRADDEAILLGASEKAKRLARREPKPSIDPRGGERFQDKLEAEKKRLGDFEVGERITNNKIRDGKILKKNKQYAEIETPDGKIKRRLISEMFTEFIPEEVQKKAVERVKAEEEARKAKIKEERLKTIKDQGEKLKTEKASEYAPGYVVEFPMKGEIKTGKVTKVGDKTVSIYDPKTKKTHIRKKENIKVIDKSKGSEPDLFKSAKKAEENGKGHLNANDWVYSTKLDSKGEPVREKVAVADDVKSRMSPKPSKPIGRKNIIESIERLFKIPIRKGSIEGDRTAGIFKSHERVIRIKEAYDLDSTFHELAHDIDKNVFGRDFKEGSYDELEPYRHELEDIATPAKEGQDPISEGLAEGVRIWLQDKALSEELTPKFKKYLEKILAEDYTGTLEPLNEISKQYEGWKNQSTRNKYLGEMDNTVPATIPDRVKKFLTKEGFSEKMGQMWYDFKVNFVDKYLGVEFFSPSAYRKMRILAGINGKIESFMLRGTHDFNNPLDVTGKGLQEIIKPSVEVAELGHRDLDVYLVARRVEALAGREKEVNTQMSLKDAKELIGDYEKKYPQFKKTAEELQPYQDSLLRNLVDSGILSEKQYKDIKSKDDFYVPLYRLVEAASPVKGMRKMSSLEAFQPIRTIKGGKEIFKSPTESIYKNTAMFLEVAEKNGILKQLHEDLIGKENIGSIFEGLDSKDTSRAELIKKATELTGDAKEVYEGVSKELLEAALDQTAVQSEGNTVKIYIDGKPQMFEVDARLHKAIKGMRREEIPTMLKMLEMPAKTLRIGSTITPDFIIRAGVRDVPEALFKTQYGITIGDILNGYKEAYKEVTGKGSELFDQLRASGGSHSGFASLNRNHHIRNMNELARKHMSLKNVIFNEKMGLQTLSEIVENAPRIAEFKKGLEVERAKAGGKIDKAGIERAALAARSVTMDFARMGNYMSVWNRIVPFANAHMQGWATFFEAFKSKLHNGVFTYKDTILPIQRLATSMVLPSIALATLNAGQKWYQEVPQYLKDNFWLFKFPGTDKIFKVPKPYEMSVVANAFERLIDYHKGNDPKAFEKWYKHLFSLTVPLYMPAMVAPMVEHFAERTLFTGRDLIPQNVKGMLGRYKSGVYTSEFSKKASKILARMSGNIIDTPPAVIDNYIRAWSGSMGQYALSAVDWTMNATGITDTVKPDKRLGDYPFLRSFAVNYPLQGSQSVNQFFDKYNKLTATEKTIKSLIKEGNYKEAAKLQKDFKGVIGKDSYKALINMMGMVKGIYKNKNIDPKEKRDLIDQIYFQMTTVAASVLPELDKDYKKVMK